MTAKHSRSFQIPIGNYDYKYIAREAFSLGVRSLHKDENAFLITSPERALCDLVANSSKVNLRNMKDVEIFLEQDIRMDMEVFYKFDANVLEKYIEVGNCIKVSGTMRNEIFDNMLSRYGLTREQHKRNAIFELNQQIIFAGLYVCFFESAAFYGGTCQRIFHGLHRFSEDMDFYLLVQDENNVCVEIFAN